MAIKYRTVSVLSCVSQSQSLTRKYNHTKIYGNSDFATWLQSAPNLTDEAMAHKRMTLTTQADSQQSDPGFRRFDQGLGLLVRTLDVTGVTGRFGECTQRQETRARWSRSMIRR